jgi:predicted nucleic acid-binding protein
VSQVCLDSWAILRWLEGTQPAAGRVASVLRERPVMSWINVAEVFYVTSRSAGPTIADEVVRDLRAMLELDLPTVDRVLAAAAIKADHRIALADTFALATAVAYDATLLTGDPEIIRAEGPWRVEDLRHVDSVPPAATDATAPEGNGRDNGNEPSLHA